MKISNFLIYMIGISTDLYLKMLFNVISLKHNSLKEFTLKYSHVYHTLNCAIEGLFFDLPCDIKAQYRCTYVSWKLHNFCFVNNNLYVIIGNNKTCYFRNFIFSSFFHLTCHFFLNHPVAKTTICFRKKNARNFWAQKHICIIILVLIWQMV